MRFQFYVNAKGYVYAYSLDRAKALRQGDVFLYCSAVIPAITVTGAKSKFVRAPNSIQKGAYDTLVLIPTWRENGYYDFGELAVESRAAKAIKSDLDFWIAQMDACWHDGKLCIANTAHSVRINDAGCFLRTGKPPPLRSEDYPALSLLRHSNLPPSRYCYLEAT